MINLQAMIWMPNGYRMQATNNWRWSILGFWMEINHCVGRSKIIISDVIILFFFYLKCIQIWLLCTVLLLITLLYINYHKVCPRTDHMAALWNEKLFLEIFSYYFTLSAWWDACMAVAGHSLVCPSLLSYIWIHCIVKDYLYIYLLSV